MEEGRSRFRATDACGAIPASGALVRVAVARYNSRALPMLSNILLLAAPPLARFVDTERRETNRLCHFLGLPRQAVGDLPTRGAPQICSVNVGTRAAGAMAAGYALVGVESHMKAAVEEFGMLSALVAESVGPQGWDSEPTAGVVVRNASRRVSDPGGRMHRESAPGQKLRARWKICRSLGCNRLGLLRRRLRVRYVGGRSVGRALHEQRSQR